MENEKYVDLEIELTDQEFMALAMEAHKQDITFNELCRRILKEYCDRMENQSEKDRSL